MPPILHDKFYTPDPIARKCVGGLWRTLGMRPDDLFIEPSAGAGAFCRHLPAERLIALDILPEAEGIAPGDFLGFTAPDHPGRRVVIGNPPFGRNGALARAFLRHAMGFADIVAFILPASFAKPSMQRGIHRNFHLVHQSSLAGQSFETSDGSHTVNTVFQIWERRDALREDDPDPVSQTNFSFVQDIRDADLVIRRVGTRAGVVLRVPAMTADGTLPTGYAPSSNYYLKAIDCDPSLLATRMRSLDLARFAQDAVSPSLSKRDLVGAYVEACAQDAASADPGRPTMRPSASIPAKAPGFHDTGPSTNAVRLTVDSYSKQCLAGSKHRAIVARKRLEPLDSSGPASQRPTKKGWACFIFSVSETPSRPSCSPARRMVWLGIYPRPPDRHHEVFSLERDPCRITPILPPVETFGTWGIDGPSFMHRKVESRQNHLPAIHSPDAPEIMEDPACEPRGHRVA